MSWDWGNQTEAEAAVFVSKLLINWLPRCNWLIISGYSVWSACHKRGTIGNNPDRIRNYDLPHTSRTLWPLNYKEVMPSYNPGCEPGNTCHFRHPVPLFNVVRSAGLLKSTRMSNIAKRCGVKCFKEFWSGLYVNLLGITVNVFRNTSRISDTKASRVW